MTEHTYIKTNQELISFAQDNQQIDWLAFDTEFIGENKFKTLLCLIQIATENGIYLVDCITVDDLSPFLTMVENPAIEKITHAGDNDFRLLFQNYGTIPQSIFDTQVACGFLGHGYPISFSRSMLVELNIRIPKGQSVTDWAKRPLETEQIKYAIGDVVNLKELRDKLHHKLSEADKLSWFNLEIKQWEDDEYFKTNPIDDYLRSSGMEKYGLKYKVYLYRLLKWREQKARSEDKARSRILPKKAISLILKNAGRNVKALRKNRIINNSTTHKYLTEIEDLFEPSFTDEEISYVDISSNTESLDPIEENSKAILHQIAKRVCLKKGIAPTLVLKKEFMAKLTKRKVEHDWRTELLGETMCEWLRTGRSLNVVFEGDEIKLTH